LDLNSFDLVQGRELLAEVEDGDDDTSVEFFMSGLFQHFGVDFEEFDDRGSLLVHGDNLMFLEHFPGIAADKDTLITFDRQQALAREDMLFLTYDHPIVESSLSLLLERNEGAASMCQWERSPLGRGLLLECSFVLEAKGPKDFELARYLPVSCKEVVLTHQGKVPARLDYKQHEHMLRELRLDVESPVWDTLGSVLPKLASLAEQQVEKWAAQLQATAKAEVEEEYTREYARLQYLLRVNPGISADELERCAQRYKEIIAAISLAIPRLDGVRVIFTS
jgi:ATP-dependent helicase HepA